MGARDTVELRLRLPVGELGQLAHLMEQARGLLAREGGGDLRSTPASAVESAEETEINTAFDPAAFHRLKEARRAEIPCKTDLEAAPMQALEAQELGEAVPARAGTACKPEAVPVSAEPAAELEIPSVKAAVQPGAGTSAGSADIGQRLQAAESPAASAGEPDVLPPPLSAVPEVRRAFGGVQKAGFSLEAQPAEARGGIFAAVEELVQTGPAPLTAEGVALAFQRDDRRYDNGFPLY